MGRARKRGEPMSLIPYPQVPAYPGVPTIPRTAPGEPSINIALSNLNAKLPTTATAPTWGIFDSNGDPLYTPTNISTLSTFSIGFSRAMNISDFPIEAGAAGQGAAFASFNKVWQPANPIVTLAISGSDQDLSAFLATLDAATISTNLYTVVTPDASYVGYSIESYSYQRTAQRGATMLMVEISLKEILQVQPAYSSVAPTPINSPQSPAAVPPVNSGLVVPATPAQASASSALRGIVIGVGPGVN